MRTSSCSNKTHDDAGNINVPLPITLHLRLLCHLRELRDVQHMVAERQDIPRFVENLDAHIGPAVGDSLRVGSNHDPAGRRIRALLELHRQAERRKRIVQIEVCLVCCGGLERLSDISTGSDSQSGATGGRRTKSDKRARWNRSLIIDPSRNETHTSRWCPPRR